MAQLKCSGTGHENDVGAGGEERFRMIDTAGAEPALIEKHGRGVVMVISVEEMVISVEEYERLSVRSERAGNGTSGTKGASKGGQ